MFKGRHFDRSVILLCVRWYLAYSLSLRNLEEMMAERGISVDHATVPRWVVGSSPELLERFNRHKRAVSPKWHLLPLQNLFRCNTPFESFCKYLHTAPAHQRTALRP
jgi:hypothetical protein